MKPSKRFSVSVALAMLSLAALTHLAKAQTAPGPVSVNLDIEGPSSSIFNGPVSVPACSTPNNATSTVNGFCAFAAANLPVNATWSSSGALVNSINNIAGDSSNFWLWFLNGNPAQVGIDSYPLQNGDNILWTLGREPLKVSVSTTTPDVNATTTVTVLGFNPINFDFEPVSGASIVGTSAVTDANGNADIVPTSTTPFIISASATGFISSQQFTITPLQPAPAAEQITLTIRDGTTTAFSGSVPLAASGTPDLLISPTNSTSTIDVPARSVLGVLEGLEASSSNFSITNLSYSTTFNSFLINCVAVPAATSTPDCFDWTDAVNGAYPQTGVDHQLLNNGDVVYLFFGPQHQTMLSTNSVTAGQPFTATAEQYDLPSGTYKPLTGVTLGVGTPNPDFTFTEIATSTVDNSGQATFTINTPGNFVAGIKEDFYFPNASITITAPQSGGGGGVIVSPGFNVNNALKFLSSSQNPDGSFGSDVVTDWTAVAFAAANPGAAKTKLYNYLLNAKPVMSSITDYERHAMALEALGINPYNGTPVDYITPIVQSFDGTQIGSPALDNDDIFAIFPLTFSGYANWFADPTADPYSSSDPIIQKEVQYIISQQKPDGSWDESVDMTAAAIQAIGPFTAPFPGNTQATAAQKVIGQAVGYLVTGQQNSGGWGSGTTTNVDSTSWVQTMINSIPPNHSFLPPFKSATGLLPTDALAATQQADGGVQSSARVWSTSYAVVAASPGKSWYSVLQPFTKPTPPQSGGGGGAVFYGGSTGFGTTTSTATSTLPILPIPLATSTPATTTIPTIIPLITPSITPTTTVATQAKPKIKTLKPRIKAKAPTPEVLSASTSAPPVSLNQGTPPTVQTPIDQPGPFKKFWNAVTSFFEHLF